MRGRTNALPVVVVQELGLVGGHVHVDGAVAQATLAGQAQVEAFADRFRPPSVGDELPVGHLEQQVRAPPGGVLFFLGDLVAGAHDPRPLLAATLTDPCAAAQGLGEVPLVLGVGHGHFGHHGQEWT